MQDLGLGAGLAAMAFWGFIAAVAVASIWDGIRKRDARHETVRRLVESGEGLDEAVVDKLVNLSQNNNERHDQAFKVTAFYALPTSVGLAVFALILGIQVPQAQLPMLGAAALLACIGLGFLVAAKIAARWYEDSDLEQGRTGS